MTRIGGVGGWTESVLVRGIRWRLVGSILIVVTAAIAVGSAVVGPLFLRAGGDSLVRAAVASAPVDKTSFELVPASGQTTTLDGLAARQRSLLARAGQTRLYEPALRTMTASLDLPHERGRTYASRLTYRTDICARLRFVTGRCVDAPRDAVISDRSARRLGLSVGSTLALTNARARDPVEVRITGVYRLPDLHARYWLGDGSAFFQFGHYLVVGHSRNFPEIDDLFVASPAAFAVPADYRRTFDVDSPLRAGVVTIGNASAVRDGIRARQREGAHTGFAVESGLPSLLSRTLHQRSLMNTIVAVAAVQLVLLAIWVLTSVLLRSADLRRAELRVARLRGFPPRTLLTVSITEPAALCAIGAVLGVVAAWVVVLVAASSLFSPGTTVAPDTWTFVAFGAALLTIGAVLGLSALRLLRSSGLGAPSARSTGGRARAVTDASILAVAVVALVAASTSGALSSHSNPVAAAAPAVVALGTSVIAIRIVELACRRLSVATLDSSAVASFLAIRRIARRPAVLREGRTLVIAVGLACFAVSAWSVARGNRLTAARFSVGANTVVTVDADARRVDRAVDAVDPHGRFAMAAVEISTASTELMGVDAARMAQVASWPAGLTHESVAAVGRTLAPPTVPEVDLADGALAATATVSGTGAARRELARLHLRAWLFDPVRGTRIVDLGALHVGGATYRGAPQAGCPCRLVGIGVLPAGRVASSGRVRLRVGALGSRTARAQLTRAAWRPTTAGVQLAADGSALGVDIPMAAIAGDAGPYEDNASPMASVADHPTVPTAVAGPRAESLASDTLPEQGLDGNSLDVRPVIAASALPRIGSGGVFLDLGALRRNQVGPAIPEASEQVWLGPRAPADAVARLRAAGLDVAGVQRSSTLVSEGRHTGPALAYDFMLLATLVALLVAAVGTFGVLAAAGRQRATEMVALEVAGVDRPILTRSLAIEAAILAVTALFGVAAGAGSAAIALPSLPQLAAPTDAPLAYTLPIALLVAVAAGAVLVVLLATALAARGILTRMSPTLLRTAPDDVD